ncbi:MFS transporter [Lysobacter silvisoli]|uniref:MFS transporter n=1 Tax=Lysobacter silvisoli TaxID=2293254 RepID=A0A371K3N3_9GAMM|nr:MFS transporter [Lysobacter silvisoli]RDZ28482.1 MFS transporter [Lysobacter silvisoli]
MPPSATSKNATALAAVSLSALMFGLEISSVPVILPTLETLLRADFKDLQWIMNAYTIACTTVLMAAGTLADRCGRRRMLLISLLLFGATSLICGLAREAPLLIVARFAQGMSAGAMLICQTAVLSHQFRPGPERSKAFAVWGIVFGIGLGFGPIIGGAIVALSNWQWVFLVHAPLSLLTMALAVAGIVESRDTQAQRLDLPGILTLSLSVLGLTYYITQGPELGYASPAAIGIVAVTLASFVAFLVIERVTPHPMFDFSVFKSREFSGAMIGSVGMNFSFWPLMIYLPIYFQGALGYDAVATGLALLAYTLPTLVVPPLAERLALRYRPGLIIPAGLFAIGLGFLAMRYGSAVEHPSWLSMLPGALLAGFGLGLTNTPVTNTATGAVSSDRAGMASGIDMSARLITLAINIALMGFILLAGIASYLRQVLPASVGASGVQAMAQRIAAGQSGTLPGGAMDAISQAALVQGFGWVLLFGGLGACVLAVLSLLVFGPGKRVCLAAAEPVP